MATTEQEVAEYAELAIAQLARITDAFLEAKSIGKLSLRIEEPVLPVVVQHLTSRYPTWEFYSRGDNLLPHGRVFDISYRYLKESDVPPDFALMVDDKK